MHSELIVQYGRFNQFKQSSIRCIYILLSRLDFEALHHVCYQQLLTSQQKSKLLRSSLSSTVAFEKTLDIEEVKTSMLIYNSWLSNWAEEANKYEI